MDFVSGVVVFILLWWWVFLMALPFGVKAPDSIEAGHATSAPEKPMIWRKALAATVIAGCLFVIVYWIIDSGFISLDTL
jgi:predicted secreted protein